MSEAGASIIGILTIVLGGLCCLIVPIAIIAVVVILVMKNKKKKEAEAAAASVEPEYSVQPDDQQY